MFRSLRNMIRSLSRTPSRTPAARAKARMMTYRKFGLQLEMLEAREVPAAIAFNNVATYTQDFQTANATNLTPAAAAATTMLEVSVQPGGGTGTDGWYAYHQASGTPRWGRSDGTSNTGSFFILFDGQSTPNRAFGSQGSGSIVAFFGTVLQNTSGATINSVSLTYDALMNRNPSTTANPYPLSYRTGATAPASGSSTGAGTFNDAAGTWVPGTGFTTPTTGTGAPGTQAAITPLFRIGGAAISQTLTSLNWAPNEYLFIRWKETDDAGADATAGVDNVSIAPVAAGNVATSSAVTAVSPTTAAFGNSVSFTATVTAGSGSTPPPAGTVNFRAGAGGTILASTSTVASTSGNTNTFTASSSSIAPGLYSNVVAEYVAAAGFDPSTSAAFGTPLTVTTTTTTTLNTITPSTLAAGVNYAFTGTVVATNGSLTPSGTVEIRDGGSTGTLLATATSVSGTGTFTARAIGLAAASYTDVRAYYIPGATGNGPAFLASTSAAQSLTINASSPTTLAAGDAVINGYYGNHATGVNERFSFVILKDVTPGTVLNFTDAAWDTATSAFGINEGFYSLSFNAAFTAGTRFYYEATNDSAFGSFFNFDGSQTGLLTVTGGTNGSNSGFSNTGDNITAFQGTITSPTSYVFAFSSTAFLTTGAVTTNDTYVPTGLVAGTTAISLNAATSNATHTTPAATSGTVGQIDTIVSTLTNWTVVAGGGASNAFVPPTTTYTVVAAPTDAQINLSVSSITVAEGNTGTSTVTVTVVRSGNVSNDVSVDWATGAFAGPGPAAAGSDYVAGSGTVNFAANATTATFTVTINGDTTAELNERFRVTLSNPVVNTGGGTASLGAPTTATVAITNDDGATAVAFTPGDLLVYRVGDGSTLFGGTGNAASGTSAAIFLDEYGPDGFLLQSKPAPASVSASISATSEGGLTLSADGRLAAFAGYQTAPGTAGVAGTSSAAVPRAIGTVDAAGTITANTTTTAYSGNNIRSVATVDGKEFWTAGTGAGNAFSDGVRYYNQAGVGGQVGTIVNNTFNTRTVAFFNGQLYWGTGSTGVFNSGPGVYQSGAPIPTSFTTDTLVVGDPVSGTTNGSPYQFTILDMDASGTLTTGDRLYFVDDRSVANGGGLYRSVYNGASWGTLTAGSVVASNFTDVFGLTGVVVNSTTAQLYGTRAVATIAATGTSSFTTALVGLSDTSGTGGSWVTLASATGSGTSGVAVQQYRGVAIVPTAAGATDSGLTVAASPASAQYGTNVTLTATVNAGATGYVSFLNGTTVLGTAKISGTTATLTFNNAALAPNAATTISAYYGGDATYAGKTSTTTVTATGVVTTTTVTSTATNPAAGTNLTFTATIHPATGSASPTGTVVFTANGVALTGTVSYTTSGADLIATLTVPTALVQAFTGTYPGPAATLNNLTPGVTSVTAVYGSNPAGDGFIASTGTLNQKVQGQAFGTGNALVYRVGEGITNASLATGIAVYVDEYTGAAGQSAPVQTFALPTVTTGAVHAFVQQAQQSATGQLSLSGDGQYVFLAGYEATPPNIGDVRFDPAVNRTVARIKYDGTVETGVTLSGLGGTGNINGIYSPDGSSFYVTGASGVGIRYVSSYTPGAAAQASTLIASGVGTTNITGLGLEVLGGQLYVASSTGATLKLGTVGSGTPTTAGQTITPVPGIPLTTAVVPKFPVDVYGADLDASNGFLGTGIDTLYVSDDGASFTGGTITKWTWSNSGGTWTNSGTITAAVGTNGVNTFYWLAGRVSSGNVTLFTTWGQGGQNTGGGDLFSLTDTTGYGGTLAANTAITSLASVTGSGTSNEMFRGVAFVPVQGNATTATTVTSNPASPVTAGTSVTFTATITGSPSVGTVTFYAGPGLTNPIGGAVSVSGGAATSAATTALPAGVSTITAVYSGGAGFNGSQGTVNITVNQAPTITSAASTTFTVGTAGTFTVTSTGFPNTFTYTSTGTLPSGVTLSSAGVLSGTPAAGTGGTYPIVITSSNGINPAATQNFTLTVNQAPAITSAASTTFTVGTAGTFTVTSTGFPNTFTYTSTGTLPSGVTLSSGGVLSGTPASGTQGSYAIVITSNNGVSPNATQNFTLTVNPAATNGQFQFSSATYSTAEGVGTFSATVTRTGGSTGAVTVPFTVTNGSAGAADFSTLSSTPISFAAGQTTQAISFSIVDDGSGESAETFSVALGTPSLGTLGTVTSTTVTIADPLLLVTSLTPTASGVYVNFNRAFDPVTLNLYDNAAGALGAADVTVTGAAAQRGTLVVPPAAQTPAGTANSQLYFVRTGAALAADTYTVAIRSATDGLKDKAGVLLDGDNNGTAGGNYSNTFVVAAPSQPLIFTLGDMARGATQAAGTPLVTTGLPLTLNDTTVNGHPITAYDLKVIYDPALFTPTGFTSTVAGFTGAFNANYATLFDGRKVLAISAFNSSPLPGTGPIQLGTIQGTVPAAAPYGNKEVLSIVTTDIVAASGAAVNNGIIPASTVFDNTTALDVVIRGDDAVHLVAYPGDVNGSGSINGGDASLVAQVGVGQGTGFVAFQNADPLLIADVNSSGVINGGDASLIAQKGVGLTIPQIPDPGPALSVIGGPDPRISIGDTTAAQGGTVTVSLNFLATEVITPGLNSLTLAISWDPNKLTLNSAALGTYLASLSGWGNPTVNIDNAAGTARIIVFTSAPEATTALNAGGQAVALNFAVASNAALGATKINLMQNVAATFTGADNNNGALVLIPAPTNANTDTVDGTLTITAAATPTARVFIPNQNVAAGGTLNVPVNVQFNNATAGQVGSVTVSISFDPTKFQVTSAGAITLGALLTTAPASSWSPPTVNLNNTTGTVRIVSFTSAPTDFAAGTVGTAFVIPFAVAPTASGTSVLNVNDNIGGVFTDVTFGPNQFSLPLSPAPTNGATDAGIDSVVTITVSPNQPPRNTVPLPQTYLTKPGAGGTNLVFSAANGNAVTVADPDAGTSTVRVTLTVSSGTLTLGSTSGLTVTGNGNGTVVATGTLAALNAGLDGLTFTPTAGLYSTVALTVNTNDLGNSGFGGATYDLDSFAITPVGVFISEVNLVAPVFTVTSAARATNVVTVTTSAAHSFVPGQRVTISGNSQTAFNGSFLITTVPTATTFRFSLTGGALSGTGGLVQSPTQYVELFSTLPNYTLPTDAYFVGVEGDSGAAGNPGNVQDVFPLAGYTTGANGYLVLAQRANQYTTDSNATVVANSPTNAITGAAAQGFGNGANNSNLGGNIHTGANRVAPETVTNIEAASATYLLIRATAAPTTANDIDANDDGTPDGAVYGGWTTYDSVGILDGNAAGDRAYGMITFRNGATATQGTAPAALTLVGFDGTTIPNFVPNYVGRVAALKGWNAGDWVASRAENTSGNPAEYTLGVGATSNSNYDGRPLNHIGGQNNWTTAVNVTVNDGGTQRSQVTRLVVNFTNPSDLPVGYAANFGVTVGGNAVNLILTPLDGIDNGNGSFSGVTQLLVQFAPTSGVTYNLGMANVLGDTVALNDGAYILTVSGTGITDNFGAEIDPDGNGIAGGTGTFGFYRLFGDINGDREVGNYDAPDYSNASLTYNGANQGGYLWYFDYNGDGLIDALDDAEFGSRYA